MRDDKRKYIRWMHIFPLKKVSFSFTSPGDTTPSALPHFTRGNTYSVDSTNAMVRYCLALYIYPFRQTASSCLLKHRVEPVHSHISLLLQRRQNILSLLLRRRRNVYSPLPVQKTTRYHYFIPGALAVQRPCEQASKIPFLFLERNNF